ncbi:nucleic acid-binding protein [Imleria badia]|nr:nucleic acid-binding protein [Imleria badia]
MSYEASLSKLHYPLKDLVANAQGDTGRTDTDKQEVVNWIDKVAAGDIVKSESFPDLESILIPRTYTVSNYLTAADVALYGALHPTLSQLQPAQYHATPAIIRYFDHIQTLPSVRAAAQAFSPAFSTVPFDFESAPKIERKQEPPKKKEKTPKTVNRPETGEKNEITANSKGNAGEPPKEKKEKKEKKKDTAAAEDGGKKGKGGGSGGTAPAEDAGEPVPSMIDLRVGHIIDVKKHPDADSLYIEQMDLGEETGPRTVVSGLVNYIPIEEMQDKYLVAICNLKPASMRGVKSFAMVLAATSKDGKDGGVELIQPPPSSKPGERVYFEGPEYENAQPVSQLNPKKKIFETIQPGFTTLDTREAAWINPETKSVHRIRTKDGVCIAPTFVGASLS